MTGSHSASRRWPARVWLAWLGLLLLAQAALAEVEFTAAVDRKRTSTTQPIRLTLAISSTENLAHVPAPQIDLRAFDVHGPSVSQAVNYVNGHTTHTRELTYTLYARKAGRLTIGSATLQLQGEQLATRPITIEVTAARQRPRAGQDPQASGGLEDNLFIRAAADRQRAYVGQQVTVTYDLCYRYQLREVGFSEIPSFSGFWVKDLHVAQTLDPQREVIDGLAFNVSTLRQAALFPTRSGAHRIEPLAISCSIPRAGRRRNSLFDSIFDDFGRSQTLLVRSEAVEVEALPLPKQGQPEDFGGAVGRFAISATAQPRQLPVGDPVTLRVRVEGEGNFQTVGLAPVGDLDGFKVYDPKQVDEERVAGDAFGGSRTFEYILIPERGGRLRIPAVAFSYFDPEEASYRTVTSADIFIDSQGGVADGEEEGRAPFALTRTEIAQVGSDIRYIKPDVSEVKGGGPLHASRWYWVLQAFIPLAYLGLWAAHRHRIRLQDDTAYARRRRARPQAMRRLKEAEGHLEDGKAVAFHDGIDQMLRAFLADHANVSEAGLTKDDCAALARQTSSADEDTVRLLVSVLERCEYARYARAPSTPQAMRGTHEDAQQVLRTLGSGKGAL